jgi:hypothetical protein
MLRAASRWLATLAIAFGLAGCGLGLVYPRLDTVVGFYIEGLVTLDPAQAAMLKRTLAGNLEWHRESELTRYAAFLREMAGSVGGGAGRDDWLSAAGRTEAYWRDIFEQAAPGYASLAATFTDAQVEELLANLERQDEDAWREFADRTPSRRQARREKSLRRAVERFTGALDPGQRALIREHVADSPSFMEEWRENRRVWRDQLAAALAMRGSGAEFESRMFILVARPDDLWTPRYRAAFESRRDSLADLFAALDRTLTPGQRAAARRELLALADELQGLAGGRG